MTSPRITRELLGQHPALQHFVEYVELYSGEGVDLNRIQIRAQREATPNGEENNLAQDGIVELIYSPGETCNINQRCPFFFGKIHGPGQAIFLRHGWVIPRMAAGGMSHTLEQEFAIDNIPTPVAGACEAVHALGGAEEAQAQCTTMNSTEWALAFTAGNWVGLDLLGTLFFRRRLGSAPFSRFLMRSLVPAGEQTVPWLQRLGQTAPRIGAGGIAMAGTHLFAAPALGIDTPYHHNERFALGALTAHGSTYGMDRWLASRAATAEGAAVRSTGGRISTSSLGSGLISAALVDTLIGPAFGEAGSTSREVLRGSAFFLPQIYRGLMGSRSLALTASRPRLQMAGKVAGYTAVATFLSDLAYMGYGYFSDGAVGSGREHALYQRAGEIQAGTEGHSLLRGAMSMLAPSLTQRYGVSDRYVAQARQEFSLTADSMSANATQLLRQTVIHGDAGQNRHLDFYQNVDLSWLQSENTLGTVRQEGRPNWYLDLVAEDLGDPNLIRTSLEGRSPEEQIRFMQGQYEWNLSTGDVQEIFTRIALHHARQQLGQVHYLINPSEHSVASHFDEQGRLQDSQSPALLDTLFGSSSGALNTDQILALRKVGLLVRIRQLREDVRGLSSQSPTTTQRANLSATERDLETYSDMARQLGLIDATGNFTPGELSYHARRVRIHPAQVATRPQFTGADLIREVYGQAALNDMNR